MKTNQDAAKRHYKTGVEMIADERSTHELKGWTAMHDDTHTQCQLADAAIVYAHAAGNILAGDSGSDFTQLWPFEKSALKLESDAISNLVKAGSFIAAEIDRLLRIKDRMVL